MLQFIKAVYLNKAKKTINNSLFNNMITEKNIVITNNKIEIDTGYNDINLSLYATSNNNVISNEGFISKIIVEDKIVVLTYEVLNSSIIQFIQIHVIVFKTKILENIYEIENPNAKPGIVPEIQEWAGGNGSFIFSEETKINILNKENINFNYNKILTIFNNDINTFLNFSFSVNENNFTSTNCIDIYILPRANNYNLGCEGYFLEISSDKIIIKAQNYQGLYYAFTTIKQQLWLCKNSTITFPIGIIRDYPKYIIRGIFADISRTPFRYALLKDYVKIASFYKLSEIHFHINDDGFDLYANENTPGENLGYFRLKSDKFKSLKSDIPECPVVENLNKNYFENFYGNPQYTKKEWKALYKNCEDNCIKLLTEFDIPGHSQVFSKYALSNPDNIAKLGASIHLKDKMQYLDIKNERALWFIRTLLEEFLQDKTITNSLHIGNDEYDTDNKEPNENDCKAFSNFVDMLIRLCKEYNLDVRSWSSNLLYPMSNYAKENLTLDHWSNLFSNIHKLIDDKCSVVNVIDTHMYGNPARDRRDIVNKEGVYKSWNVRMADDNEIIDGEKHLKGAKSAVWGDETYRGVIERDVHHRMLDAIAIVSQKTWNDNETMPFEEWDIYTQRLAEGPNANISMHIPSKTDLVLSYNPNYVKKNAVIDQSGNNYHAEMKNVDIIDTTHGKAFSFCENSEILSPLRTLSYPYTAQFDLMITDTQCEDSFILDGYDARLKLDNFGNLISNISYFKNVFTTNLQKNKRIKLEIVGAYQSTKIFVDGKFIDSFNRKIEKVTDKKTSGSSIKKSLMMGSFVLPLEKICSNTKLQLFDLKVYNTIKTYADYPMKKNEINVAQNKYATSCTYKNGDIVDDASRRLHTAAKAINGDAGIGSDCDSYWQANHENDYILIDLNSVYNINSIELIWIEDYSPSNYTIKISKNNVDWEDIIIAKNNTKDYIYHKISSKSMQYVKVICQKFGKCKNACFLNEIRINKISPIYT